MSSRVVVLLGVVAMAVAVWVASVGRQPAPVAASADLPLTTTWVATAHQRGIVGYRDPAVAVSPGGRLIAYWKAVSCGSPPSAAGSTSRRPPAPGRFAISRGSMIAG